MIFPWQKKQWAQLSRAKEENRLPHALLFAGIAGLGKSAFACAFSHALLCLQVKDNGVYCDTCHACHLLKAKTHPNVLWVEPEKPGHAIKVDQIRAMTAFVNQSALQGNYRLVLITPANSMNANAANALLKTLEEPTPNTLIILISDQSERLPATILSRCQRIVFQRPSRKAALDWLASQLPEAQSELLLNLTHGAPLAALHLAQTKTLSVRKSLFDLFCAIRFEHQDPIQAAGNFADIEIMALLDFVQSWIKDVIYLQLGGGLEDIINQDYYEKLLAWTACTSLSTHLLWIDYVQQLRTAICNGINLNKQLMIENILIRLTGAL